MVNDSDELNIIMLYDIIIIILYEILVFHCIATHYVSFTYPCSTIPLPCHEDFDEDVEALRPRALRRRGAERLREASRLSPLERRERRERLRGMAWSHGLGWGDS